jgi:hypothetical protein
VLRLCGESVAVQAKYGALKLDRFGVNFSRRMKLAESYRNICRGFELSAMPTKSVIGSVIDLGLPVFTHC